MAEGRRECKKNSVYREWAMATTAHGFSDLVQSTSTVTKVIWLVLISLSLSIMTYQVYDAVDDYCGHQWISTIKEIQVDSDGAQYPSIIVCNFNRLKNSSVKDYSMTYDMIRFLFLLSFSNQYIIPANSSAVSNPTMWADFNKWQMAYNLTYLGIYEKLGPKCTDIFVQESCDDGHITPIQTLDFGRCYRVDTNGTAQVWGSKGGKTLLLDTQGWDYLPIIESNFLMQGLAIQLSYTGVAELGNWINLKPGTHTTINMQITKESYRLPKIPSGFNPFQYIDYFSIKPPCFQEPLLRYFNYTPYTLLGCAEECFWQRAISKCNCIPYLPNKFYRTCEIDDIFPCLFGFSANYTIDDWFEEYGVCFEANCQKPCDSSSVEATITETTFPSDSQRPSLEKWLVENGRGTVQLKDIIVLEYYFGSLNIKWTEHYDATTLNDLVSNIGGLIGVWIGMSFLTIFQAIQYSCKYVNEWSKRRDARVSY